MNKMRILVTAVGGDVSQAIIKCLKIMKEQISIYGSDSDINGIGEAFVDKFIYLPHASDSVYVDVVKQVCDENQIDAIIPGSEPEILALSKALYLRLIPLNPKLVCQNYHWVKKYGDKLSCYQSLNGKLPIAGFADGLNPDETRSFTEHHGLPCVVKSRRSWGSKSLNIAYNHKELREHLENTPYPVLQEFIDDKYGEYSLGVFAHQNGIRAVSFKRDLGPVGASWYADNHTQATDVVDYAIRIAKETNLEGSCNVQVRKSSKGVRLLEINPRFSSLVAARAACGFKDLEWSLKIALNMDPCMDDAKYRKIRFRRYLNEMIDFGNGYQSISEWQPRVFQMKE
jgi:carbamoyl-phosphate synthase large subunit